MKVGDLVKHKYSKNKVGLGIVLNVREGFYQGRSYDYLSRLTVLWPHGKTTIEAKGEKNVQPS